MNTLTPEQQQLLNTATYGGLDAKTIADVLSISRYRVAKFRPLHGRVNGVRRAALQRGLTPYELERRIASEYRNNVRLDFLVGKYRTSIPVIHSILEKHGVEIRPARRETGVETFRRLRKEGVAFATPSEMTAIVRKIS